MAESRGWAFRRGVTPTKPRPLKRLFHEEQDLHNWQNKHTDGLLGLVPAVRERFVRFMPDQLEFGKQWDAQDPKPLPAQAPEKELLRYYCQRNFGSLAVTFEFPWFGRTPDDMRATGRKAIWALLRAMDPPPPKSN